MLAASLAAAAAFAVDADAWWSSGLRPDATSQGATVFALLASQGMFVGIGLLMGAFALMRRLFRLVTRDRPATFELIGLFLRLYGRAERRQPAARAAFPRRGGMSFWPWSLGGPAIWALHFLGLYSLASAADVAADRADAWRGAGLAFSLACLAATAVYAVLVARRLRRASGEVT